MTPKQQEQLSAILKNSALLGKDVRLTSSKIDEIMQRQQMIANNQVILENLIKDFVESFKKG